MVVSGREIVNHLKKGHKKREISLSEFAYEVYRMILKHQLKRGIVSEWLLTNAKGERRSGTSVNRALLRVCNRVGVKATGIHSIRRTVITDLILSSLYTQKEIQSYSGHTTFLTTSKYYDYSDCRLTQNRDKMDRAINLVLNGTHGTQMKA